MGRDKSWPSDIVDQLELKKEILRWNRSNCLVEIDRKRFSARPCAVRLTNMKKSELGHRQHATS